MNPKYEKIINMERPVSKKHPRMDRKRRAAQFAPFESLRSFKEKIQNNNDDNDEDEY